MNRSFASSSSPIHTETLASSLLQRLLLALLLIAWLCTIPGAPAQTAQPAPPAEWTFLVYLAADCDLEEPMLANLEEMGRIGSTAKVQILALVDRPQKDKDEVKAKDDDDADDEEEDDEDDDDDHTDRDVYNAANWGGAKLFHVEKEHLTELADWGKTDMGSPKVLERFLRYGIQHCPAKRFAVVLNDHGNSWHGLCYDEGSENHLSLGDLRKAFTATAPAFGGRLELIGLDACLMANLDVATCLAPYARYMVASEELVPGSGWEYRGLFGQLNEKPEADGLAAGRIIVDTFRKSFSEAPDKYDRQREANVTMAVIDLQQIPAVAQAAQTLATRNLQFLNRSERTALDPDRPRPQPGGGLRLDPRRRRTRGRPARPVPPLRTNQGLSGPDPATQAACDILIARVRAAVPHEIHGKARPQAHGLSVFLPLFSEQFDDDEQTEYRQAIGKQRHEWLDFMEKFVAVADNDDNEPELQPVRCTANRVRQGSGQSIELHSSIRPQDVDALDNAYFVLGTPLGIDQKIIIGQFPAAVDRQGTLRVSWEGQWFALKTGEDDRLVCPIYETTPLEEKRHLPHRSAGPAPSQGQEALERRHALFSRPHRQAGRSRTSDQRRPGDRRRPARMAYSVRRSA